MSDATTDASSAGDSAAGDLTPVVLPFAERFSDRLNPILIRELHQSLGGRVFIGTLSLACFAIVALALAFTWASGGEQRNGADLLTGCTSCLAVLCLIIVPMQAFTSTRQEVSGGTAAQLLMTRLRPRRIVSGKLAAAMLQFALFLSVFAPLIAITYLLGGIDVPTILVLLVFAVLASITAVAFAVAMATISATRQLQHLIQALTLAGLFVAGFSAMIGSWGLVRELSQLVRFDEFWIVFTSTVLMFAAGAVLCGMIAAASLAHAYENRSTGFRLFAFGLLLAVMPWCLFVLPGIAIDEAPAFISATLALVLAPFWLWANCEDASLSPRVRTLVPRGSALAAAATPFLPGGQRGFVFTLLLAGLGIGVGLLTPLLGGVHAQREGRDICLVSWSYVVLYAAIARLLRTRLRRGRAGSILAFALVLAIAIAAPIAVLIVDLFLFSDVTWHLGHLTNPIFTIDQINRHPRAWIGLPIGAGALALLLGAVNARSGFREVSVASRERRELAKRV
ncbi:MAG: hypothetical protein HZB39_13205 [Planctomycetes bacterium]|nr:hypothetical protein [Planctomycetota bacterium]